MTYRERRAARVENLRLWAERREQRAAADYAVGDPYRGDIAFATQPGHIPERARVIRATERAFESMEKAENMRERADSIERQAAHAIYSDDPDAPERLREKIAALEASRERIVAYNKSARAAAKRGEATGDLSILSESEKRDLLASLRFEYMRRPGAPFAPFVLSNLSGNIKRHRDRLAAIEARAKRSERAADAGGVLVTEHGEYVRVTFAEKPDRAVLDSLRAAGFWWRSGSWNGLREKLPDGIA